MNYKYRWYRYDIIPISNLENSHTVLSIIYKKKLDHFYEKVLSNINHKFESIWKTLLKFLPPFIINSIL